MHRPERSAAPRSGAAPAPSEWTVEGFAGKTRISTSFGDVPAHLLRRNDAVRSREGSFHKIVWIDHVRLDEDFMRRHPEARPVLIRAGALGRGTPSRDVELSPCQELCLGHGRPPVMARSLLGRPGVMQPPKYQVTYTRFRCGAGIAARAEDLFARITE